MTCGSTIPDSSDSRGGEEENNSKENGKEIEEEECRAVLVRSRLGRMTFSQLQTFRAQTHILRLRLAIVLPSASPGWRSAETAGAADA